jgi:protein tyrosine/serine phosphatase
VAIALARGRSGAIFLAMLNHNRVLPTLSLGALLAGLGACSGGFTPAKLQPQDPSGNFHQVSDTMYRGGRPDEPGVQALSEMGVRLIVDLEDDIGQVARERGWAEARGIKHVSTPMNGERTPDDDVVNELLATFADPEQGPVFVHCQEGVDRTGMMVGLHRVFNEQWTPADAYTEMKTLGFKTHLSKLRNYYSLKTGYQAAE